MPIELADTKIQQQVREIEVFKEVLHKVKASLTDQEVKVIGFEL